MKSLRRRDAASGCRLYDVSDIYDCLQVFSSTVSCNSTSLSEALLSLPSGVLCIHAQFLSHVHTMGVNLAFDLHFSSHTFFTDTQHSSGRDPAFHLRRNSLSSRWRLAAELKFVLHLSEYFIFLGLSTLFITSVSHTVFLSVNSKLCASSHCCTMCYDAPGPSSVAQVRNKILSLSHCE